jgi:hypothetical protein
MCRIKLGILACFAVVAFAAFGPASASAAELKGEEYPVTLKGVQVGEQAFKFEGDSLTLKCPTAEYQWEMLTSRTVFGLFPNFGNEEAKCSFGGLAATVKRNGCIFDFHAETKVTGDEFKGSMGITCSAGAAVVITTATCEIQIAEQTKLSPVTFLNVTTTPTELNHIRVNPAISKSFKYNRVKDGLGCPLNGTGELADGTFEGVTKVVGENKETLVRQEIWFV